MILVSSNRASIETGPPGTFSPLNPFIADSGHHRPIGSGAVFADASHPFYDNWVNGTPAIWGDFNVGSPFGRVVHPVNSITSPRVTIGINGQGEDPVFQIPATNIPHPPSITFNSNTPNNDSVVVFIEEDTGRVHEFRECRAQSGFVATSSVPMVARSYRPHWAIPNGAANTGVLSGLGHGLAIGESFRVGHSASGTSALFGVLRVADITENRPIGHVLQTVLPANSVSYEQVLSKEIVLPAVTRDGFAGNAGTNNGTVPYGGLLSLPHGFDVYNRGYTAVQLKLAECIRDYGIMAVDHGANFAIRTEQGVPSISAMTTALRDLKPHLRLTLNSAWDPNDRRKPAGGGTPRAINTGYDA